MAGGGGWGGVRQGAAAPVHPPHPVHFPTPCHIHCHNPHLLLKTQEGHIHGRDFFPSLVKTQGEVLATVRQVTFHLALGNIHNVEDFNTRAILHIKMRI